MLYLQNTAIDRLNASLANIEQSDCRISGRLELYTCKSVRGGGKKLLRHLGQRLNDETEAQERAQQRVVDISVAAGSPHLSPAVDGRRRARKSSLLGTGNDSSSSASDSEWPPVTESTTAATGPTAAAGSTNAAQLTKKRLFYLISALNAAFPDYDFDTVKSENFHRVTVKQAMKEIATVFTPTGDQLLMALGSESTSPVMTGDTLARQFWTALDNLVGPHATEQAPAAVDTVESMRNDGHENKGATSSTNIDKKSRPHSEVPTQSRRKQPKTAPSSSTIPPAEQQAQFPVPSSMDEWDQAVEVYNYLPDDTTGAGDPYDDEAGSIWSFHYFFYNRRFKRLIFFSVRASSWTEHSSLSGEYRDSVSCLDDDDNGWEERDPADSDDTPSTTPHSNNSPTAGMISTVAVDGQGQHAVIARLSSSSAKRKSIDRGSDDADTARRIVMSPVSLEE